MNLPPREQNTVIVTFGDKYEKQRKCYDKVAYTFKELMEMYQEMGQAEGNICLKHSTFRKLRQEQNTRNQRKNTCMHSISRTTWKSSSLYQSRAHPRHGIIIQFSKFSFL
jgi:hypothetical protein